MMGGNSRHCRDLPTSWKKTEKTGEMVAAGARGCWRLCCTVSGLMCGCSYMEKLCFLDRTSSLQTQFIKQVREMMMVMVMMMMMLMMMTIVFP